MEFQTKTPKNKNAKWKENEHRSNQTKSLWKICPSNLTNEGSGIFGSRKAPSSCTFALTRGSKGPVTVFGCDPEGGLASEKSVDTRTNGNAARAAKYMLPICKQKLESTLWWKKIWENSSIKAFIPVPLVLAGRLTAALLAACSCTSWWVTGCGRRRWRRWRHNAKGSEDTIEAIFGPPETSNCWPFKSEKNDLQTCTLVGQNDANIYQWVWPFICATCSWTLDASAAGSQHSQDPIWTTCIPSWPSHKEICRWTSSQLRLETWNLAQLKGFFQKCSEWFRSQTRPMVPVPSRGCLHLKCWRRGFLWVSADSVLYQRVLVACACVSP